MIWLGVWLTVAIVIGFGLGAAIRLADRKEGTDVH